MHLYDPLHNRQSHACSLVLLCPVQALEYPKKLVGVTHVEAGPVVPHEKDLAGAVPEAADLDPARSFFLVYLRAFESRFSQTCLRRLGSPKLSGSPPTVTLTRLSAHGWPSSSRASLTRPAMETVARLSGCRLRRAKDRRSSISLPMRWAELRMV